MNCCKDIINIVTSIIVEDYATFLSFSLTSKSNYNDMLPTLMLMQSVKCCWVKNNNEIYYIAVGQYYQNCFVFTKQTIYNTLNYEYMFLRGYIQSLHITKKNVIITTFYSSSLIDTEKINKMLFFKYIKNIKQKIRK